MGSGGAPEGVLTAAALRCLGGEMLGRLVVNTPQLRDRVSAMGLRDADRIYRAEDLAPGGHIVFAATGVTAGALLNGVRFFGAGYRTHSLVLTLASRQARFLDTVHITGDSGSHGIRLN